MQRVKSIANDDDDAVGELEFDLTNSVKSELAPDGLDKRGLIDIDADVATNNGQPLTVEEIVNEYRDASLAELTNGEGKDDDNDDNDKSTTPIIPHPAPHTYTRNDIDEEVETLSKLSFLLMK